MGAASSDRPVPLRRRLKDLRRATTYHAVLGPALSFLERAPVSVVRAFLRGALEPIAHAATRRLSNRHLEMVYGDAMPAAERRRVARRVTHNFVLGIQEFFEALRNGPASLDDRIDDSDARALVARMEADSPRGFLALTGHVGNWELLGSWIARHSARGTAFGIAKRHPNAKLNARLDALRRRLGLETLYREDPPTRPIRELRAGHAVAVVPDQDVKNLAGIFVDFLGHRAYTPLGPARLALAANVPIACGFLVRAGGDGRFRIEVSEPIHPDRKAPRADEIERLTRAWSAAVEAAVRAHPEQWAWFHERWKTTPEKLAARGRRELDL